MKRVQHPCSLVPPHPPVFYTASTPVTCIGALVMYRVLYVDDEPGLLDLGRIYLEGTKDFVVDTETEARHALTILGADRYDVVVSDYMMPEIDGITFLKAVRQQYGDLPFILFTGRGREEVVIDAINNGADFYLQKGGDPKALFAELAHKIRQAVSRKQAQEDRDRSETNFQNLVDNAPDAIFIVIENRYQYVNTAALRLLGAPNAGAVLGTSAFDRIHPSLRVNIGERVKDLIERKKPVKSQDEIYLKMDGTPVDVEVSAVPFLFRGEQGALLIVRDITERKQAETELRAAYGQIAAADEELRRQYDELARSERQIRESEERYRRLTTKLPIPLCVADENDVITFINDRFTTVFGYTHEDIPTLRKWWELAYPDSAYRGEILTTWTRAIGHAIETGSDIAPTIYRVTCKDGTVREVEISGIPFEKSFLATFVDLTERVRAEAELRKSEESYRGLFNTVRQAIYIQDADWKFIDVNDGAVAMYGYSREEFIGRTPEFLSAPDKNDLAAEGEQMKKAFAGEPQQFIFWARKKNGEIFKKDVRVYKGIYFGKDVLIAIGTDINANW